MIYLTNGNMPLNAAYEDRIVQEDGSTYQLTFRFPTSDPLWEKLKEETFLTADDLHGEQDFVIFEVEKKNGYIQVYANQVFTLLNNYVVNPISLDRQTGSTALSRFAGSITRSHPFSFFSDISERHTFNIDAKNAMEAFAKDKHSILGQWGGDLVRHGYQVRLLKNGGSENESLFMYKKNLSSYQHKTSTKSLKTRITFKTTVKGEGEKAPDRKFSVVVDSPLINKYSQIYEDVIEVNDEDVKDEASLRKYGEQYFKTSLCDMMENSLELEVVGQSDVPVQMYDIVSLFYEVYNLDVRKKITKYTYSPMANKLLSIGFGKFKSGLSNMVSNAVSDAVKNEAQQLHDDFERQLERELKNADLAFDKKKEELVNQFTDGLNAAKAKAEEVKRELSDTIDQRFSNFDNGPLQEVKRRADEALQKVGASSLLAQEAKQISERAKADIAILRQNISNDYVAKSQHVEDVRGLTRRFEEINLGSPNLVINGAVELGDKNWGGTNGKWFTDRTHGFYKNSSVPLFTLDTKEAGLCYIQTNRYNQLKKNTDYTLSFTGFMSKNVSDFRVLVGLLSNKDNVWKKTLDVFNQRLSPKQAERFTIQFNSGDYDGFSLRFDNFGSTDGQSATVWITEIDVYEGTMKRAYQPAPENSQNYADTKISEYRTTVDGRFASITSQIAGKANLLDFQRVQETSKLYERIIGRSESDIADKIARMALTNQLFQVEVAKASAGGRNLFLNSLFKRDLHQRYSTYYVDDSVEQTQGQLSLSIDTNTKFRGANTLKIVSTFNGKPNNQKVAFRTGGDMRLNTVDEMRNKSVRFSFWAKSTVNNTNFQARAGYRNTVEGVSLTTDWKFYDIQLTKSENSNASNEVIMHVFTAATVWIAFPKVEIGTASTDFSEAPEDTDEAIRSVQSQLAGSWAVQNLTSAGSIVSQINATNNQILIEAEKIRLKGKTLLDELTAIQGYFKRLFVGEGNFAKLNAEIIGAKTITADKLIMDSAMARMFVSSDIFTDTLAAKEAFINKLRSVVVSATLLEGYKGKIGGFQIGTHDKDPYTYWLTGQNQFYVGMSSGAGSWGKTALWVNWGTTWESPGKYAWFVKESGAMYCYNTAHFWNTPVIHGDLRVTGYIYYNNENSGKSGYWIHSSKYLNFEPSNDYLYLYYSGSGYDWIPMNKEISDRRYKHNIEASTVSGLDIIEQLKTYSYRKEYDGRIEDISCGIMAQDVQKYAPEAFYENPDGAYSYKTFALVPYLIKAIQELNQKIEKLEKTA
ncbi:hypothetical protein AZJ28_09650 [Streptococcus pneumoniae]|uniref:Peptidase S74 domain-containing protein n=1 Tax=Streptococcus pneumoniae TaxID=1313 RepID=A0A559GX05_STREE|nr:hypothetical protein AZJ28_09650 [Streptococcus pneumoniae]